MTYAIYDVKTVMRKLTFLDSDFNENDVIVTSFYVSMTLYTIFHKLLVKLSEINPSASTFS